MKFLWKLCTCILLAFSSCYSCAEEKTNTADSLSEKWRIISLAPSTTTILEKLNLDEYIVATDKFSKTEKDILKIGGLLDPNYELITEIDPTHIIGLKSHSRIKEKLNFLKSKWVLNSAENLENYFYTLDVLGKEFEREKIAEKTTHETKMLIESLRKMASLKIGCGLKDLNKCPERKKILIIISRKPGETTSMLSASKNTFISELIEILGVENAIKEQEGSINPYWPNLTPESLVKINPDEIWEFGKKKEDQTLCCEKDSYFYPYLKMKTIKAVQKKSFKLFESDNLTIPGPNMMETLKTFAIELYPESKKEIEALVNPSNSGPEL